LANGRIAERTRMPLVANHVECLCGPSETRALEALARGREAACGRGLVGAIGVVEAPLGAPHNVGRQRRVGLAARRLEGLLVHVERRRLLEEAERALDLPTQVGGRGDAGLKEDERKGRKASGRREPTHEILPHPSTRDGPYLIL